MTNDQGYTKSLDDFSTIDDDSKSYIATIVSTKQKGGIDYGGNKEAWLERIPAIEIGEYGSGKPERIETIITFRVKDD
ncbi:MAG: hypothetical protein M9949_06060 [Candidatus Kapabacteria bacterium]|nr:hypothetical protein [Candidatus Kapabacteria bacterium]